MTTLAAVEAGPPFACVCCGHENPSARPALRANTELQPFDLYRCDDCGVIQQFPRWSTATISALYRKDYYVFAEKEEDRWARAVQQYYLHLAPFEALPAFQESRRSQAAAHSGLRLLDVGCAHGHLAALARMRGWRVTGIDISADAVSEAAVRFGLDVRAGSLSSHAGTLMPSDVVLLGDVIEHVPDPVRTLQDVRKLLSHDGVVCIDTPNWGGFWRRWGGRSWLGLNRFHINFFDAQSLSLLLERCGFRDVVASSYTHYRYGGWIARPEVMRWTAALPGFIAWRVRGFLERRRPTGAWLTLRSAPPSSLDAAMQQLSDLLRRNPVAARSPARGDNLIVHARR